MKVLVLLLISFFPIVAQPVSDLERPATYRELRNLSWGVGKRISDLEDSLRAIQEILHQHEIFIGSEMLNNSERYKKVVKTDSLTSAHEKWLDDLSKQGGLVQILVYLLCTYMTGHAGFKFFKSKMFGDILVALGTAIKKDSGSSNNG